MASGEKLTDSGDDLLDEYRLPSREMQETENSNTLPKSEVDTNQVLNQVERYEKLANVLTLLKQAKEMEEKESRNVADQGLDAIKTHIKAALDEAIKLRIETDSICAQTS